MKKIIQIAKLELGQLFFSPIAWLLLIALFLQLCLMILPPLNDPAAFKNAGFLTSGIYTDHTRLGLFQRILEHLYLYIPLLTMGIMSREISSGSIKLLYSSPLKLHAIVYGKFLAMALYNLLLLAIIGIFALVGACYIPHFDYPLILVALLSIYLLLNTYAAIGIFVSSLTSYQTVAAISTFAVLTTMNYIGGLGQEYDFIRDLTYSLSMPSRAERMINGLLNSRDILYYLVISGMFLAFTIAKMQLDRKAISGMPRLGCYAGILLISLSITYISSRQALIGYYDATATKLNTITKASQHILKQFGDKPVEITAYINGLDDSYFKSPPKERIANIQRWEPYLRFNPHIKLNWVYYYDTVASSGQYIRENNISFNTLVTTLSNIQQIDISKFLAPQEVKKIVDLSQEEKRFIMEVKHKGKTTFLRTFPAPDGEFWPGEPEIAAAFKRLQQHPPKLVFATDGYQRSMDKLGDRDYKTLINNKFGRASLVNQGFDVDSISLERDEIPDTLSVLVISDPRVAFTQVALGKLRRYIEAGGNLLITGEPGKQQVINPLLQTLGVEMLSGTILQQSRDYSYDLVTAKLAPGAVALNSKLQPYFQHGYAVSMPQVGALAYQQTGPFTIHPLLTTDPQVSWKKEGKFVLDSAAIDFDPLQGDRRESFPTTIMMTRPHGGKEQRIIVSADADFFSNTELSRNNMIALNAFFATSIFKWFSYGKFPVDSSRPIAKDSSLTLTKEDASWLQVIGYGIIPGIIILLGTMVLLRRKRK